MTLAPLLALALAAATARAQFGDEPPPTNAAAIADEEQDSLAQSLALKLEADPQVADSLALRIMRSRLVRHITSSEDQEQGFRDVREWIDKNRDKAAQIGVGLMRDDYNGNTAFEDMMMGKIRKLLQPNPNAKHGIFGRLHKSGKDSKVMKGQTEDMSDEEQQEILKSMFEGQGSGSGQVANQKDPAKKAAPNSAGAAGLKGGYYDRLSQGNLRGYSPQLQAMQSALNARRAPGAPKLIETGKLDYATLSHPAYGMRFDFSGLEKRLIHERSRALARLLGLEGKYTAEQLADPKTLAELEAKAAGKDAKGRFARRRGVLDRAAAAIRAFEEAAALSKDPSKITRGLLITLGERQRDAARWITIASLEEELDRLESTGGFLTPELVEAVHACPVTEAQRRSYLARGERLEAALTELKAGDEAAIRALEADDWLQSLDRVDKILARSGVLRKEVSRSIDDYRSTAFNFAGMAERRPAWRQIVDRYAERLLPRSSYSRRLASARRRKDALRDAFILIAQGDLAAAHAILALLP